MNPPPVCLNPCGGKGYAAMTPDLEASVCTILTANANVFETIGYARLITISQSLRKAGYPKF
jgi:hypothetical protein